MTVNFYVYVLHCNNNSYYTGYTTNVLQRYQDHLSGKAKCKYTASFKPTALLQCWQIQGDKALAMKVERYIKNLKRLEKELLLQKPELLSVHFPVTVLSDLSNV